MTVTQKPISPDGAAAPFTGAGFTHDVYRKGEGPGVVLIPEMPGIHPGVLALGKSPGGQRIHRRRRRRCSARRVLPR